ncbi:hypothetical protein BGM26_04135 [Bacillus sp. FJAT-29790]|uniref:hypothetical protein n=1 Tax=Bacillus sp. FJAT-29790 TaxID=1895002 RepID=UPI001C21634B|nr:hypothetical protein [Bacillus sp. FJAT-29790]MBU8878182.1 hypothetical protein [Bacillus sp. FJAT-29790]
MMKDKFHNIYFFAGKVKLTIIYTSSSEEAETHFWRMTGKRALNCLEMSPDEDVFIGYRYLSFREWKKEQRGFPCLVRYY